MRPCLEQRGGKKEEGKEETKEEEEAKGDRKEGVEKSGMVVLECNSVVIAPRR